jgi:hypothetical protein
MQNKRLPIPGYCLRIEMDGVQDCHKIVDNRCTVYNDVCAKVGREGFLGCAFSPLESYLSPQERFAARKRVGQQKQVKKWRQYGSKNNRRSKYRS